MIDLRSVRYLWDLVPLLSVLSGLPTAIGLLVLSASPERSKVLDYSFTCTCMVFGAQNTCMLVHYSFLYKMLLTCFSYNVSFIIT